jgi:hypothetical protein
LAEDKLGLELRRSLNGKDRGAQGENQSYFPLGYFPCYSTQPLQQGSLAISMKKRRKLRLYTKMELFLRVKGE